MKKKELARKITSWLTLGTFSLQPALAFATEILPDRNAPIEERPLVTETASGNPLVQITTPTAGGVSVNRYEFFNVPERGAILNNSYGLTSTELAGYVQGNPNLAAGTARIIVNEVTSANPSELRGFLEVAGDKAGVVIANPNGILADGAGFLNTARVTLATGRTEMDASGNLAAIRVEGGKLSVTGNGLNAQSTDSAEIYARAIEINAGLWAKNARLAAGANEIRYADGTITPIKGTENAPAYALDLAAIGGMYANRIELVGTEKGLGVNLAGQITSTEATSLDVNGNLKTSGNLYTDGSTRIHADEIENSGAVYSKENTVLTSSSLQNSGKIVGGADTAIHASAIANTGTLAAAIAPSGKTNDAGTLTVTAKEFDNNNAQLLSGKDIVVSAENIRTQNSRIAGNGDISLVSQNALTVENSTVQSGKDLSVEADAMPLAGNLSSGRDMTIAVKSGLSNETATENFGNLHAGRNLTANLRGNVYHQRKLEAGGTLSLATTGNLTQTAAGEISGKSLAIHTADTENRGLMQADEEAAITASNLKNDATGRIYGNTIHVQATHIRNEKNANLEARLAQEMRILKEKAELLEAAHRVDVTKFTSHADIAVYKANIQTAESAYDAQQKVVDAVKAELAALPSGVIAAREALALQANSIQNNGNALLYSGGDLSLAAKEEVANRGARIEAQGSISITAPLTKNENAAFSAKRVITETKDNPVKLRIDEGGHIEQGQAFPAEEFREINSGYGAYHSYVAPKVILEPAEYKPIEQISEEERVAGEKPIPDELIGTLAPTYAYDDPIFKQFGIASMSTDRPAADDPARSAWDEAY
ncbi:MAG: filamentous hemagglutinin N-terminal domain-containing protein, partial [Selenomonas sp.]